MSATVKGLWTKAELSAAKKMARACEATSERWAFADWLLAREPVGKTGHPNGSRARMNALGAELGWTANALLGMRATARAWPPQHRVPAASFAAHSAYMVGGAALAGERSALLTKSPRKPGTKRAAERVTLGKSWGVRSYSLHCGAETYAAVVAEADATGRTIGETADELISEALEARAWLAAEAVAA